jgi:anti-anti-sigma factor
LARIDIKSTSLGHAKAGGVKMSLVLNARGVGKVTVVQCSGRIVAGNEMEALRAQISGMMQDRKDFVLHLGEVAFIDSSGLGTMVRLLTSTRKSHGDLKLCNVPQAIEKLLQMTNLNRLFETHETEESAISAFYRRGTAPEEVRESGPAVLCVDQSSDVLAYLRELLKREGHPVHTTSSLRDALILLRATHPALLVLGPSLSASPATRRAFETARTRVPVVELGGEFSTLDAGEAASRLLESIQAHLRPKPGPSS